jgi:hypothetical protein
MAGFWYDSTGGAGTWHFCNDDGIGVPVVTSPTNRDSDGDGTMDGHECMLETNPGDPLSRPSSILGPDSIVMRFENLSLPGGGFQASILDGEPMTATSQAKFGIMPNVRDSDRDGCADGVELADVDGDRIAGAADRLAVARAVLGIAPFTHPLTADEVRTADVDANGVVAGAGGTGDRLLVGRITLSTSLATILDYQTNCTAAAIGYEAD